MVLTLVLVMDMHKKNKKQDDAKRKTHRLPDEVDTEMEAELDKKLIHLAKVRCISMGIEQGEASRRMPDKERDDGVTALGVKEKRGCLHVCTCTSTNPEGEREVGELRLPGCILHYAVRRRRWREEGEPSRHRRCHSSHLSLSLTHSLSLCSVLSVCSVSPSLDQSSVAISINLFCLSVCLSVCLFVPLFLDQFCASPSDCGSMYVYRDLCPMLLTGALLTSF